MRFIERLRARGEGKEQGVPFFLHEKVRCYDFCKPVGLPTIEVLRRFETPDQIDLDGLPDEFVIKPSWESSSRGVMVLRRVDDGYHDAMTGKTFTGHEVVAAQRAIYDAGKWRSKPTIVEEKIVDAHGHVIPEDYKAYAFQGEVALIVQMNRNGDKTTVAWFDGDFNPLEPGRVTVSEHLKVVDPVKPRDWEAMLHLARRASIIVPTPFASIDLYASTRGPLLGEVTLVPGGFYFGKYFVPSPEQDRLMGEMWSRALERLGQHAA